MTPKPSTPAPWDPQTPEEQAIEDMGMDCAFYLCFKLATHDILGPQGQPIPCCPDHLSGETIVRAYD